MDLVDLLKELRQFQGQQGYRYFLAWLAVFVHIGAKPMVAVLLCWFAFSHGADIRLTAALFKTLSKLAQTLVG